MWNSAKDQIKLIFIRHGKTPGNERHAYIGSTNESLSDTGIKELNIKKEIINKIVLEDENCDTIALYCSPMKRCRETAYLLFPEYEYRIIKGLEETDFGEFEGKNYEDLCDNKAYQEWVDSNGRIPFPKGESKEAVTERTLLGFWNLIRDSKERREVFSKLVLVVHGGTIMTILSSLYGGEYYDYQVGNGEGYQCVLNEVDGKYLIESVEKIGA